MLLSAMPLKLDFHSVSNTKCLGFGRMYFDIRSKLETLCSNGTGVLLMDAYTGGDVQIYVGGLWDKLAEHFERKAEKAYCYTMWEASIVPDELIDNINKFDGVIVPSEWGRQLFMNNGITKPIHVIPLGVDIDSWPVQNRIRKPDDIFTIIWRGTFIGDRKGGDLLIEIFKEMNLPNSRLILKLNPGYTPHQIRYDLPYPPLSMNIRSICKLFPQEELLALLSEADLSVYPSYGEGFGLMPLEDMATGLPVILSDNTAMSQFCDYEHNIPITCDPKGATYGELSGIDYMPRREQITHAIEYCYNNREHANHIGLSAAEWVKECWNSTNTAKEIIKLCLNGQTS